MICKKNSKYFIAGVTPFASILQTIVDKYNSSGCFCSECDHWNDHGTFNIKIKKVGVVSGLKVLIKDHVLVESSIPLEFSIPLNLKVVRYRMKVVIEESHCYL